MVKIFFTNLIVLLTLNSCVIQHRVSQAEKDFVLFFKGAVLYGALNGYSNGGFQDMNTLHQDLGLAPNVAVIYHSNVEEAKKLGENFVSSIQPSGYADYEGRSPYYSESIKYAFGDKVDSIAKAKFREMKRLEKK